MKSFFTLLLRGVNAFVAGAKFAWGPGNMQDGAPEEAAK